MLLLFGDIECKKNGKEKASSPGRARREVGMDISGVRFRVLGNYPRIKPISQ